MTIRAGYSLRPEDDHPTEGALSRRSIGVAPFVENRRLTRFALQIEPAVNRQPGFRRGAS